MKKKVLSVFFVLNVFVFSVFAQFADLNNYVSRIWTSSDGLPGNSVTDIIQSKDGFMYFGTYEGLVKFDGYDFNILNKYSDDNYTFVSARTVFEDSNGVMWVGSNDEGIQKLKKNNKQNDNVVENQIYTTQNGLSNNSIRAFAEDKNRNIWVGTAAGICYITRGGSIGRPAFLDDIDSEHILVNSLYCDTAGRIWLLGNDSRSVYLYSGESFSRYTGLDSFGDYIATAITQDSYGNFWVALGQQGIVKISNGTIKKIETGTIIDNFMTKTIFCDNNNAIWFGCEQGIVVYSHGVFTQYGENNSISNSSIQKIQGDREGNIWVASSTGGIGKISAGKFSTTIMNSAVNAICEAGDGKIWIGADDGLHCYDGDSEIKNDLTDLCKDVRVRHVQNTSNGDLLVNCYGKPGQIRYSKKNGIQSWTTEDGIAGNRTRVSIETRNGDVYVGTTSGLSIIKENGSIHTYKVEDGFDNDYIMCLYQDDKDYVWVGTDGGGIFILQDEKIIYNLKTEDGLSGNVIFKIKQDNNGRFWICTGAGISRVVRDDNFFVKGANKNIANYTSANGLLSDSIFQVIDDGNQNFWMVSNRGISSAEASAFEEVALGNRKSLDCKFYNQNDGLKSSGANSTALSMVDKHGRIWFTMADGYAVYDPVRNKSNHILPIIQLEEVKIDEKVYYDFDDEIKIPPGAKYIDIKYTGLSFAACERNRFTFKMEGFDNDFSELSTKRSVSYTNLKPGHYTFYVTVQNGAGDFAKYPAKVNFYQKAFFYQLVYFWIGVALAVLLIIFLIFWSVIKSNKKKQLILETKIQMATIDLQIARDESDSLLKNILPEKIANKLKGSKVDSEKTIAEKFENVTVLFSDIVGFTSTTSNHTAEEIVSSLNDLVSRFDVQAKKMHVEKIKTIGDAYMAVCGAPELNEKHAEIMLKFATIMFKELNEYNKTAKIKFRIRIGLCSGPVIAGVIGKNKFIYDIWGDTVNVASRMESNCDPMHVRMTESVVKNLEAHGYHYNYKIEEIDVKGKGLMKTYQLPNH